MKETKTNQTDPIKPRRKYDATFKREAVVLWLNSGKSARQIAADLGICEGHLYSWKSTHGPVRPATANEMESQLAALRAENAQLRQQRDILKKTLGILSEPPTNASNGSQP